MTATPSDHVDAFDADVLIYASQAGHTVGSRVRRLFAEHEDRHTPVGVGSVLLVPELLTARPAGSFEDELVALGGLLERLDLLPVEPPLADLAASFRGKYRLKTVDAIHLATAVEAGADRFITNNSRDFPKSITEIDVTYPVDLPEPTD